jgi:hypothetical protein
LNQFYTRWRTTFDGQVSQTFICLVQRSWYIVGFCKRICEK